MSGPAELFEGPYTLEGVLHYLRTVNYYRAVAHVGEKFYLFPDTELVRIYEELEKEPGDAPNSFFDFLKAGTTYFEFQFLREDSFACLSRHQVELIYNTVSKTGQREIAYYFCGIDLARIAREGLSQLLEYLEYRKSLSREKIASEEASDRLLRLGPVSKRLITELSNHVSYHRLVNFVCKALPTMELSEFSYLIDDADRMLPGWHLGIDQFRKLSPECQSLICRWIFEKDRPKCLGTIERHILDQKTMCSVWKDVLLSENPDAIWSVLDTNKRGRSKSKSPERRDASPKRVE